MNPITVTARKCAKITFPNPSENRDFKDVIYIYDLKTQNIYREKVEREESKYSYLSAFFMGKKFRNIKK